MEQASPPALQADRHRGLGHNMTPGPGREDVECALDSGQPSNIEEHRCSEGGTVRKARELLNKPGLGLPEVVSPGLGEESIHFSLGKPPPCVV